MPGSPQRVVALLGQDAAALGEIDAELTLHKQQQGGSPIVGRPPSAHLASWMDPPLHLNIRTVAHTFGRVDEVNE